MKNYKVYGNENTNLKLSAIAKKGASETSVDILEFNDGTYALYEQGANYNSEYRLIRKGMTAEEVNEYFEDCVFCDEWFEEQMKKNEKEFEVVLRNHRKCSIVRSQFQTKEEALECYNRLKMDEYCTAYVYEKHLLASKKGEE